MSIHVPVGQLSYQHQSPQQQSSWRYLSPPAKVMAVLVLLIAIAITPNAHWLTWIFYGCGILALLQVMQVNLFLLCQRLAAEFIFVGVTVLGTLFREGGSVLWQWGWLKISTDGVVVLGSVSCRLFLSLTLLNLLTLTSSIPELLQALSGLNVPPLLIAILTAMYRYLDLLIEEFTVMKRAAIARNLTANQQWQRVLVGNMIGSLFVRTYDRGNRIYAAMLARGYQGYLPAVKSQPWRSQDIILLSCVGLFALLGQFLYLGQ